MNSYILARIAVKLSGKSLTEFLDGRLFGPLHITNRFWERSAEGIEKGGWGLYLSAESWAKLGYMMLSGGEFFGKVGSFEEGYEFDAVVLDDSVLAHPQALNLAERMERAVYLGLDEKKISAKFVDGRKIK